MKKGGLTKTGKVLIVLIGVVILIKMIRSIMKPSVSAGSIGIIGGADGPTAVFVTGNPNVIKLFIILSILGAILFLASIVIIFMLIVKGKINK